MSFRQVKLSATTLEHHNVAGVKTATIDVVTGRVTLPSGKVLNSAVVFSRRKAQKAGHVIKL